MCFILRIGEPGRHHGRGEAGLWFATENRFPVSASLAHAAFVAETHFDQWIAERYRTLWPDLYEPTLIERTIDSELRTFSSAHRYVWPSELDLMARLAGLRPRGRWSDWDRSPFTTESRSHISIWEKAT
jgi:hypothetical protein